MNKLLVLLMIVNIYACFADKSYKPHLDEDIFVEVLSDLYIKEGCLQYSDFLIKDSLSLLYTKQIFDYHNVNDSFFLEDYTFYFEHRALFDTLITKVIKHIENINTIKREIENDKSK